MSTLAARKKTFSGQGRKRQSGPREPNGRLQRKSQPERAADERSVVLAQPHRMGSLDQRRGSAIARLIMDGKVKHPRIEPRDLERAAELYAKSYANMRWVIDSRRPYAKTVAGSGEPTDAEATVFREGWSRVSRALRDCGDRVVKAAEMAILDEPMDERVLAPWIILSLPQALEALAVHYGLTARPK